MTPSFNVVDKRVSQMTADELDRLDESGLDESGLDESGLGGEFGRALGGTPPGYVEKLEQQLALAQARLAELQQELRRELAEEVERTRQRLQREAAQEAQLARAKLAEPMLEVLDALERSLQVGASGSREAVLEGVERVHQLMLRKLAELGFERIATVGERFDPARHEAIGLVPVTDPQQDNTIVAELSPGFALDGRVMRVPRVQVGRFAS